MCDWIPLVMKHAVAANSYESFAATHFLPWKDKCLYNPKRKELTNMFLNVNKTFTYQKIKLGYQGQVDEDGKPDGLGFKLMLSFGMLILRVGVYKGEYPTGEFPIMIVTLINDELISIAQYAPVGRNIPSLIPQNLEQRPAVYATQIEILLKNKEEKQQNEKSHLGEFCDCEELDLTNPNSYLEGILLNFRISNT